MISTSYVSAEFK